MCDPLSILGAPSGPSGEEQAAEAQSGSMARTLEANYKANFGHQQDALARLQAQISRIQSGDTGPGFGAAENAARRSEIINQTAAGARNLEQQVRGQLAGQGGGGGSELARSSGISQQISEEIGARGETEKSNALLRNTAENYAVGREQAERTRGGLASLAGQFGQAAESSLHGEETANAAAFSQAGKNRQTRDARSGFIGSLIGKGLQMGAGFLTGGLSALGPGENLGEGTKDFFQGGMSSLSGNG